jgi:hypothetical protein
MLVQNKAQQIGRAGVRWFAQRPTTQQLPTNWIIQPPHEDVGINGVVVISENSPSNGLEFRVQIKSSLSWNSSADSISLRVKGHGVTGHGVTGHGVSHGVRSRILASGIPTPAIAAVRSRSPQKWGQIGMALS